MELIIPKTKIEEQLNKIYSEVLKPIKTDIINKGLTLAYNGFISYGRLHFRYLPDYFDEKVEKIKNDNPNKFGEKIENTFIGFGDFSGAIIGLATPFIIYDSLPNKELIDLTSIDIMICTIAASYTFHMGRGAGAYTGKILAYCPKKIIDDILTPTYENITDTLTTKINSLTDTIYKKIKNIIEIKIE